MPEHPPRRVPLRWAWLLALAPLLPGLGVGFLGDDLAARALLGSGRWRFVLESLAPHGGEFYRPLGILWLQLEMLATGSNPWLLHGLHLAIFAVAAWQTGRLAVRLGFSGAWATVAALAVLYPGRLEASVWLLGVFDLLALVLVQAALLIFLGASRRWAVPALVALAFLAPAAKEVGYALAPVSTLWWLWGIGRGSGSPGRLGAVWSGAGAAVLLRLAAFGGVGGYEGTSLASAVAKLRLVPGVLARAFFWPVNPAMGPWSVAAGTICVLGGVVAVGFAVARAGRDPGVRRLLLAGSAVTVLFLLPAVPYLNPSLTWYHSRYLTIPAVGIVLVAAAALQGAGARSRLAGGLLVVGWCLATAVNVVPWVRAARARDAILEGIERVTREPGAHTVWIDGPIGHLQGAHLVGGFLPFLLQEELPGREIHSDSRFLQRLQRRPQGPPEGGRGTLHVLQFRPDPPMLVDRTGHRR